MATKKVKTVRKMKGETWGGKHFPGPERRSLRKKESNKAKPVAKIKLVKTGGGKKAIKRGGDVNAKRMVPKRGNRNINKK